MGRLLSMVHAAVQLVAKEALYSGPIVDVVVWQTLRVGRLPRPCIWVRVWSLHLVLLLGQWPLHLSECYHGVLGVWLVLVSCPAALTSLPLSQAHLLFSVRSSNIIP